MIPGHNMPLVGLAVLILWFGWFGFNAGSTLGAIGGRFAEVAVVTNLGGRGRRARRDAGEPACRADLRHRHGRQRRDRGAGGDHRAVGLRGVLAGADHRLHRGLRVVFCIIAIDKVVDDPVGALSAHGMAGIWGTLSCGLFTSPRLAEFNGIGDAGLFYTGSFDQLGVQALGVAAAFTAVFTVSYALLRIKRTYGLRVTPEEERHGLDIVEHGMWGYPEQFMPVPGSEYHPPNTPGARLAGLAARTQEG